jgi:DNA-binding NarL/FixJ family response regulator
MSCAACGNGGGVTQSRIRVLLADDHALVRQGFRRILEDEHDIEVVGEAGGGADAIALDQQLEPDVVVLDMSMPEINGLHAAIEILRRRPERPIMILSMFDDAQYVRNALAAGVRGYILKNALETELLQAVRTLARGGRFLGAELKAAAEARPGDDSASGEERFAQLTAREVQVLRLIAMGRSNREIGKLLGLSANTVAVHRTNLMATLGVHKAAELVLIAVRKGLVNPGDA